MMPFRSFSVCVLVLTDFMVFLVDFDVERALLPVFFGGF
jgi:hypothetical protein